MAVFNQIGGISTSSVGSLLSGPLASLFGGPGANILQYPQDLTNDPSRMHWVQFTVFNTVPNDFATQATTTTAASGSSASSSESPGIFSKIATVVGGAASSVLGNLTSTNTPQAAGQVQTIINLYMPDTLNISYNNQYDELSMTDASGGLNRLAQGFQDAAAQHKAGGESSKALAADPKAIELVSKGVAGAGNQFGANIDSSQYTDLNLSSAGYAINPQLQLIYKGVSFREFQLEFIMTPKSTQESDQISSIVNAFIYSSTPTLSPGSLYYIPPAQYELSFRMATQGPASGFLSQLQQAGNSLVSGFPLGNAVAGLLGGGSATKGVENARLMKFGRCVLTNVNVDYAPNGWAAFAGGAPLQTRLTLQFKEIDQLNRNRMMSGQVR
jgi:hypothetical protein